MAAAAAGIWVNQHNSRGELVSREKLAGNQQKIQHYFAEKPPTAKRVPRALPSEYESLNADFINEYDALNLDFSVDEEPNRAAKELEVPAREFIWQEGASEQQKAAADIELPPKEWWGEEDEESAATTKQTSIGQKPVLKASKLLAMDKTKQAVNAGMPVGHGIDEQVDFPREGNGSRKVQIFTGHFHLELNFIFRGPVELGVALQCRPDLRALPGWAAGTSRGRWPLPA
jgi:hypothetical protein